jgi:O-antigen/teichoic acid export membrane protein
MKKNLLLKFNNASPAVKSSMALLFANLILKGISLISGPIYTRIMTTEQYGIVSTYLSWQNLLAVLVTLNLSSGVFNNGMLDYKEDREVFQFSLLSISTLSTMFYFVIFFVFRNVLLKLFDMPEILVYVMFANFLVVPAYSFWAGRQRYEFKYKLLTILTIVIAITSMVFGIIAILISPDDSDAVAKLSATEGVNFVVGLIFYFYIGIKAKFKFNYVYCKYALKFNVPLILHYMSMYVLSSSDRIMITKMVNTSATAIYSVACTVASVINIVWTSIEASLTPWIYEKLDEKKFECVKKLTVNIVCLFAFMCLGCTLFAPEIMAVLAPPSYSSGIYVIPSVAAGVFFTSIYSLYMRIELFYKQTAFASIATTIAAVINVVLNYIFIRVFGAVAAGYTTMICYALLSMFHYINVRKKCIDHIFNNKVFFIVSLVVIMLSVCITVLYSYTIIRYLFVMALLIMLLLKRDYVLRAFRTGIRYRQ